MDVPTVQQARILVQARKLAALRKHALLVNIQPKNLQHQIQMDVPTALRVHTHLEALILVQFKNVQQVNNQIK